MIVRDATPGDAGRLLEIYRWYVERTAVSFEYAAPTLLQFRERMERIQARYPWLVAEEDGRVVGYAYAGPFKGRKAYDWSCEVTIYLDRQARGRGLGRAIMDWIHREYPDVRRLRLEVTQVNQSAIRLYEKQGFKKVSTFPCYPDGSVDVYHMVLNLGEKSNA